ncbi:P-loop containing nucleoside triphosphate hydrolase protein [Serendipita vermifera]|nr:P-loop containing nucleoside triphosphate hydrolase protein [Serendipita vermifera]
MVIVRGIPGRLVDRATTLTSSTTTCMGGASSKHSPWSKKDISVVMVGLSGSGKTSILNQLRNQLPGYLPITRRTIGFNSEVIDFPFARITIWDVGGSEKSQYLSRHLYDQGDAFIFVVSALEGGRLLEAREELHRMCKDRDIWQCPLLVMVNKSEGKKSENGRHREINPDAAPIEFVAAAMDIATTGFKSWGVKAVSALTGQGLEESLLWITERVTARPRRPSFTSMISTDGELSLNRVQSKETRHKTGHRHRRRLSRDP